MQKYLQFLFCINHKKIAIDSICFGDVIFLSFLATWQHYRSTANLQDHFHSPPPKNKGCTDFKRITHMGSSSTREDARTCSAYDSQHPQQFYPHSLQDTTVYAVNEAAWRSLAAKGVGATGQTSQKKKNLQRAGVMARLQSTSPPSDMAGPYTWEPILPLDSPHPALAAPPSLCRGEERRLFVRHCRCRIMLCFQRSEGKASLTDH